MKICWDNLEKLRYNQERDCWYDKYNHKYLYRDSCTTCGEPFLTEIGGKSTGKFCSHKCLAVDKNRIESVRKGISDRIYTEENRTNLSNAKKGSKNPMYGKKFSKEHCKRISISNIGKTMSLTARKKLSIAHTGRKRGPLSKEHRRKVSEAGKGRVVSEETKEKIRKSHLGVRVSESTKEKLRELNRKENHPQWKGGISCEPYCFAWHDKSYKQYIFERDGHRCLNPCCPKTNFKLHRHHIDYDKKNCAKNNLITLCTSCNSSANFDREWHTDWYQAILYQRYGYIY